jgi:RNA polymerase sigma-70 factor (ECF subfamily)
MPRPGPDTDQLLEQASQGDGQAVQQLLERHRGRLRRMVACHLDRRLAARVDPSDVIQEALADAAARLDGYLRERPLPFYPWLRRLAWERLVKLHRRHLRTEKRSVRREEPGVLALPDESAVELARRLVASGTSPTGRLERAELQARVRAALDQLSEGEREVLVLRYLEGLSTREIAATLGVGDSAVKMRHLRALDRLWSLLDGNQEEGAP